MKMLRERIAELVELRKCGGYLGNGFLTYKGLMLLLIVTSVLFARTELFGQGEIYISCKSDSTNITSIDTVSVADTATVVELAGKKIVIPESSQVVLLIENKPALLLKSGTSAKITVDKNLILFNGLVFVKHNQSTDSGFVLYVDDIKVKLVGTEFAVKSKVGEYCSFAVVNGAIALTAKNGDSLFLNAKQKVKKNINVPFSPIALLSDGEAAAIAKMGEIISSFNTNKDSVLSSIVNKDSVSVKAIINDSVLVDSNTVDSIKTDSMANDSGDVKKTTDVSAKELNNSDKRESKEMQSGLVQPASETKKEPSEKKKDGGIKWGLGLGSVTIDGKQWQRINISPDIPIGKFGICFDFELFIDDSGNISPKGWEFENSNDAIYSLSRKIRYLRYGKSGSPLFVKLGAIDNVTLGYGMIMAGFRNTYEYPEYKKLGMQFEINNISPLNLSLKVVTLDLNDIKKKTGVLGSRLSLNPISIFNVPVLKNIELGVTVAGDVNQYKALRDSDGDGIPNTMDSDPYDGSSYSVDIVVSSNEPDSVTSERKVEAQGKLEKIKSDLQKVDKFGEIGFDIGLPLVKTKLLGLVLYGQYAINMDFYDWDIDDNAPTDGWGIAAPGLLFNIGPFGGKVEYRHTQNRFMASYFNSTYERDRLVFEGSVPVTKEASLDSVSLNGIFGSVQATLGPLATLNGSYQHLIGSIGDDDDGVDRTMSVELSLGETILKRIPKIENASAYYNKSRIGRDVIYTDSGSTRKDDFFENSRYTMYGYVLSFAISDGVSLLVDRRTTFEQDENMKLVPLCKTYIQTAVNF